MNTTAFQHLKTFIQEQKHELSRGVYYKTLKNKQSASTISSRTTKTRDTEMYFERMPSGSISAPMVSSEQETRPIYEQMLGVVDLADKFLVQLSSGEITTTDWDIKGREDIVAILGYPSNRNALCRMIRCFPNEERLGGHYEYDEEIVELGLISDLPNLVYAAPIPEGYTNLNWLFSECPKLQSPIVLPSTTESINHLLYGVPNFCGSIFLKRPLGEVNTDCRFASIIISI